MTTVVQTRWQRSYARAVGGAGDLCVHSGLPYSLLTGGSVRCVQLLAVLVVRDRRASCRTTDGTWADSGCHGDTNVDELVVKLWTYGWWWWGEWWRFGRWTDRAAELGSDRNQSLKDERGRWTERRWRTERTCRGEERRGEERRGEERRGEERRGGWGNRKYTRLQKTSWETS